MNAIPGFGTWKIPESEIANIIYQAYTLGYCHFDTAAAYLNEAGCGEGLIKMNRSAISVTGKLWKTKRKYASAQKACKRSLQNLRLDYFDQYLIHWPATSEETENWREINSETWSALEDLVHEGLIRHIGFSNFQPQHIEPLLETASISPYVNQIECHPGQVQTETVDYCVNHHIRLEAWSPLGNGAILQSFLLHDLGEKYRKTPAQICLKWCLQKGLLPITCSLNPIHMQNNLDLTGFSLTEEDTALLDTMQI